VLVAVWRARSRPMSMSGWRDRSGSWQLSRSVRSFRA
jgi:hypothetical protein